MSGFAAIFWKELTQMRRDRATLFIGTFIPVFQLILFGLIDTNVKHVPTAIFDQCRTAESRALISDFVNTSYFDLSESVASHDQLYNEMVAGHVSVGIEIPPNYSRDLLAGRTASVLVMIDGSDSSVASQTLAAANGVMLSQSLTALTGDGRGLRIEGHPVMLFNPDSRSANLLIPGLVAILLTFSGTLLAAFAIVKERERGTLEQLMVTPVSPLAVVAGKILPYLMLSYVQLALVLLLMRFVFKVSVHGSVTLLLALSAIYLLALLSLGLLISSRAKTQMEAMQMAQGVMLPSIMLSGYIFPLTSLPPLLRLISHVLPATHFINISRGIIIRGAALGDLWPSVFALMIISAVLITLSARAFKKTIA